MFVDCDWVFNNDIGLLFAEIENRRMMENVRSSVYCVQHDYKPKTQVKMDGMQQHGYNMKLWAALMVFDMSHPENEKLTPELVNSEGGRNLMNFCWVEDKHTIGNICSSWHFIPNHSEKLDKVINGIHLTEGGPWFSHMRNGKFDNLWWKYYNAYLFNKLQEIQFNCEEIIDAD